MPEVPVKVKIQVGVTGVAEKEKLIKNLEKLGDTASKTSKKTQASLQSITPTMQSLWQQADKLSQHWGVAFQSALPYVKKLGDSFKANTTDTYQLAQAADFVSKKFKVSFGETYNTLKRMGVGFKGVSVDVDKTAKAARKFAGEWGISFQDAFKYQLRLGTGVRKSTGDIRSSFQAVSHDIDKTAKIARTFAQNWGVSFKKAHQHISRLGVNTKKATAIVHHDIDRTAKTARTFARDWGVSFKSAYNHVSKLGIGMKKTEGQVKDSSKKMGYAITFIAWHFRYLGNIFDRVTRTMFRAIKNVITVSAELQESFLSIRTAAVMYGQSAEEATRITRELALTGLMPLTEAANSVKNLMITGLGVPEMERFAYRYLDVAFLMTSGMDEMEKSLEVISKSMLRGTLVLSTDVTARMLWIETEKRLQKTMGVSMKDLSARQKAMQILTTIEEKYAATLGFHRMETETTRAAINRLTTSITLIKDALGKALLPLLNATALVLMKVSTYVEHLVEVLGPTIPIVVALALAFSFVIAKVSFAIGVFLSFMKVTAMLGIAMWKIYLPLIAIGAIVGGATYLFLKYTGALDKAKNSMAKVDDQLKRLKEDFEGLMGVEEDSMGIEEDRRIAHERTVEDIEEDLERERSKGLWANQMAIKDLEKRLKRENEDWNRYLKKRGGLEEGASDTSFGFLDDLIDKTGGVATELGKIDFWGKMIEQLEKVKNKIIDPVFWSNLFTGIGTTFYNLGKWAWDNFLVYFTQPEFWRILGNNIKAIGVFIHSTLEASLLGLGDAVANWITGGADEALESFMSLSDRLLKKAKELREKGEIEAAKRLLRINEELSKDIAKIYSDLADDLGKLNVFGGLIKSADDAKFAINLLVGAIEGLLAIAVIGFLAKWAASFYGASTAVGFLAGTATGLGATLAVIAATLLSPFILTVGVIGGAAVAAILSQVRELKRTLDGVGDSIADMTRKQSEYLGMVADKFGKQSSEYRKAAEQVYKDSKVVSDAARESAEALSAVGMIRGFGQTTWDWMKSLVYQTGGIVPGMRNQAVPIMAHGGERVIPAGETTGGGNITFNMYNTVRNDNDIREIARQVGQVLGQRQKWSRLGSF